MAETVASSATGSDFEAAHPLWTFLTALSGVGDEFERARLTATGLPSLLPCRVSGAALLDEAEAHWSLVLQNDGEQLGSTHAEQVLAELEPLFQEALRRTSALIVTADRDTSDHRIPPSIETFGVRFLALAPVMTLQHRMGVLLIGTEGADAFSREEELTLSTLAEHLAIGIENIRLSQTLEKRSQDLEEIATRYQSLYNNTPVMMHSIDHDGKLTTVSDYWLQVLGYERSEVLGRRSTDFLTEASRRRALEVDLPRFRQTGVAKDIEYQMVKKNGEIIDVMLSATAEFDEQGKIAHTLAFIVDVTERKLTEEALGLSEERFHKIFEHSNDAIFVIDPPRDRIVDVNDKACKMLGYSRADLLATPISAIHPHEMPALMAFTESVLREGHGTTNELSCMTKMGDILPSEMSASVVEFDGEPHMISLVRDISGRKHAEEALRQSEERYRQLYDKTPVMMHEVEEHRGLIGVNDHWLEVLGYERSEVIGKSPAAFMTETSARYASEVVIPKVFKDGTIKDIEYQFVKKNGEVIDVLLSAVTEWDKSRSRKHSLAFLLDVTKRKRAERQAAERTADLESFSYSVSHDLRAPLRAIDGFSRILLEDHADKLDAECHRLLDVIRSNTKNMGQLIDDLLAFSRLGRQEMKPTTVDMRGLAASVMQELQSLTTNRDVQCDIGELPPVRGDRAMIRQAVVNLLSNALKFTSTKDSVVIEVGHTIVDGKGVYYVKDNGVGFDMQYADKLFGVFQRLHTADEFEGTGVGLAIVQRIVHRHGGRVWAEGEVNAGATIFLSL